MRFGVQRKTLRRAKKSPLGDIPEQSGGKIARTDNGRFYHLVFFFSSI